MKKILITRGRTKNGRLYPEDVLLTIKDKINSKDYLGEASAYGVPRDTVNLSEVVLKVQNAEVNEDGLVAEIKMLKDLNFPDEFEVCARGSGIVDKDGVVTEYTPIAFDMCLKDTINETSKIK